MSNYEQWVAAALLVVLTLVQEAVGFVEVALASLGEALLFAGGALCIKFFLPDNKESFVALVKPSSLMCDGLHVRD